MTFYIIKSKQVKKELEPRTNKYPHAYPPSIDPSLLPKSEDVLFMWYSISTKVIIYFDPKTRHIKRNSHCYIDEYNIKLQPK